MDTVPWKFVNDQQDEDEVFLKLWFWKNEIPVYFLKPETQD